MKFAWKAEEGKNGKALESCQSLLEGIDRDSQGDAEYKGIKIGSRVLVEEEEWGLRVTVLPEDPVAAAHGLLKGGSSLVEALL